MKAQHSLLNCHPKDTEEDIGTNYEQYGSLNEIPEKVVSFWEMGHYLSSLYGCRLRSSPSMVRQNFELVQEGATVSVDSSMIGSRSLCVNEALTLSLNGRRGAVVAVDDHDLYGVIARALLETEHRMDEKENEEDTLYSNAIGIIRSSLYTFAGNLSRSLLTALDLADDDETYYIENDDSDDTFKQLKEIGNRGNTEIADHVKDETNIINVRLVIEICEALLEGLSTNDAIDVNEGIALRSLVNNDLVLLQRNGKGDNSFCELCRKIGKKRKIEAACKNDKQIGDLLCNLSIDDVDLVLNVIEKAGWATTSPDRNLVCLGKSGLGQSSLSEIDIAHMQLTLSKSQTQARLMRLQTLASKAEAEAIEAKRNGFKDVSLIHMKRWKMMEKEANFCADILLNLESTHESILRSINDKNVVETLKLSQESMATIRRAQNEGGLGLNIENVNAVVTDLQEEMAESEEINKKIGDIDLLCQGLSSLDLDISDELEKEYASLQAEMKKDEVQEIDHLVKNLPIAPTGGLGSPGGGTMLTTH